MSSPTRSSRFFVTLFLLAFGELLSVDSLKPSSPVPGGTLPLSRRDAVASAAAGIAWRGGTFFGSAAPAVAAGAPERIADRLTATSLPMPLVKQRSEFDLFFKSGLYDDLCRRPSRTTAKQAVKQVWLDFDQRGKRGEEWA